MTGSLKWGESPIQAARRELYEETGIMAGSGLLDLRHTETFPIVPPWRARYRPGVRFNREHWFLLRLPSRRTIRVNRGEHRQFRWLPAAAAASRATSWTNRRLIRDWVIDGGRRFVRR